MTSAAGDDQDAWALAVAECAPAAPAVELAQEPGLLAWVPSCGPWLAPAWLGSLVGLLERAPRGGGRGCVGVTVRHGKTTLLICAIAYWLRRDPKLRVVYMTYSIARAQEIGKDIRDVCKRRGVRIEKGHDTIASWRNDEGGGVDVMSAQQSRLGADVDILLVDDPYESGEECDKPEVRAAVDGTILHYTSRLSRGGSCIIVMSRWRPDDAIGVRLERRAEKWVYAHSRAIEVVDGVEVALAPNVRTVEEMNAIRAALRETDPSERLWWAQWQNEPFVPGDTLWPKVLRYTSLPCYPGFRDAIGVDIAYSSRKSADWFAIACVRIYAAQMFVRSVQRFRADEGLVETAVKAEWAMYGRCSVFSYMSGPEIGTAHYLHSRGVPVEVLPARYNKRIRSRKTVDRAKRGDVLFPTHDAWVTPVEARLTAWRGNDGDEDDELDAIVSVHDGVFGSGVGVVASTCGSPRM